MFIDKQFDTFLNIPHLHLICIPTHLAYPQTSVSPYIFLNSVNRLPSNIRAVQQHATHNFRHKIAHQSQNYLPIISRTSNVFVKLEPTIPYISFGSNFGSSITFTAAFGMFGVEVRMELLLRSFDGKFKFPMT